MPHSVSLTTGGRHMDIPVMLFVAGWLVLAKYAHGASEDNEGHECEQQSLPLFAIRRASDNGKILIACVETLCRILADNAEWCLDDDSGFFGRHRLIVSRTSIVSARLNDEVIAEWRHLSAGERKEFEEFADGLIFASVAAHGQSQE